jgi:hypothetical protein
MTQSSQKYLRKLKMALANRKGKKFKVLKTHQNCHHYKEHITRFPTVNGSSNRVHMKKLWPVKVWSTRSSQPGDTSASVLLTSVADWTG